MSARKQVMTPKPSAGIGKGEDTLEVEPGTTQPVPDPVETTKIQQPNNEQSHESVNLNTLYLGNNYRFLRQLQPGSIDLIYFRQPFMSLLHDKSSNIDIRLRGGINDPLIWNADIAQAYQHLTCNPTTPVSKLLASLYEVHADSPLMTFLVLMTSRLVEFHRVLKLTGSLYLDCDLEVSHYVKVITDAVFKPDHFRFEVVVKQPGTRKIGRIPPVTRRLLCYVKTRAAAFYSQHANYDPKYVSKYYRYDDNDGKGRYRLGDLSSSYLRQNMKYHWQGFPPPANGWRFNQEAMEELRSEGRIYFHRAADGAYDTNRRPALKQYLRDREAPFISDEWIDDTALVSSDNIFAQSQVTRSEFFERIILTSSKIGDTVLDPLYGLNSLIPTAQVHDRKWVGIDDNALCLAVTRSRLQIMCPNAQVKIIGGPETVEDAAKLAAEDYSQFCWWALSMIGAQPSISLDQRPSAIRSVHEAERAPHGFLIFTEQGSQQPKYASVTVKAGDIDSRDIGDLLLSVTRSTASIGILITLQELEPAVRDELRELQGVNRIYQVFQVLTIEELLNGKMPQLPQISDTSKQQRVCETRQSYVTGTGLIETPMNYLSPEEAAQKLGVTKMTVRNWCVAGYLNAIRGQRDWRIPESALQSFNRPTRGRPKNS